MTIGDAIRRPTAKRSMNTTQVACRESLARMTGCNGSEPRRPREEPRTVAAAHEEHRLVAAEAGERRGRHDPGQRQVAQVRGEPGQHEDGLAFEEASDEDGDVAVLLDEALQRHRLRVRLTPSLPERPGVDVREGVRLHVLAQRRVRRRPCVTASMAASIFAEYANVRPRYACWTRAAASDGSCVRESCRRLRSPLFASATSASVAPSRTRRASSSASAFASRSRFSGAKIAERTSGEFASKLLGWSDAPTL